MGFGGAEIIIILGGLGLFVLIVVAVLVMVFLGNKNNKSDGPE